MYLATVFGLGILLSACGSLTTRERHQFVLVKSSPPGADIFYQGKKIATTPAYVELRRSKESTIQLSDGKRVVTVPLETSYRWTGSFWNNLVFVTFAPVGWTVDFMTGSAWNIEDPSVQTLKYLKSQPAPPTVVAIAPPEASSIELSDEGALLWERHLKARYPNFRIIPYREKLNEFTSNGYDFDTRPGTRMEHLIFGRLGVTDIFESESKETADGIVLHGHFRNVFSGKTSSEEYIRAAPQAENLNFAERFKSMIHLIPNTVGIELSRSDVVLADERNDYRSSLSQDDTFVSKVAPYISSLSFTRQTPPRREGAGKFNFEFVPAIRATYRRIAFPTLPAVQFNEFTYLTIGGGLGPEIGWQWGPNYIYINYIPIFGWHRLAWQTEDGLHTNSIGALTFRGELGYLYYLTEAFSLRLFTKTTTTPGNIWNNAIQDINPGSPTVDTGSDVSLGLVFGYTWEPQRQIHKWKIFN